MTPDPSPSARSTHRARWLLLAAVAASVTASAWGRVYYRWGSQPDQRLSADGLGWAVAHRSDLVVNGSAGGVEIMQSDRGVRASLAQLRAAYEMAGGHAAFHGNDDIGWGLALVDDRVVRILAFSLDGRPNALVVRREQSIEDFARSGKPERATPPPDFPVFPGSVPSYSASDPTTHTDITVSRTHAGSEDVRSYFDRELTSTGWTPALPTSTEATVYLRNHEICCLSVSSSGHANESVVILMRKRLKTGDTLE